MLESLGPELWGAEHDLFMPGGIHFRGRMVVVRSDEALLLHSPIPIDAGLAEALRGLGTVREIVAPSKMHHVHVSGVVEQYPHARVIGAPGLPEKRADLTFDEVLPGGGLLGLEPVLVEGIPALNECVFFHPPSRSLLITDLVFNIREVDNWQSRLFFSAYGVLGRVKQSMVVWMATRDRTAARASMQRVLAWDFDHVIPAHGPPFSRAEFEDQVGWMISS